MLSITKINPSDAALDEAERCRLEARTAVEQNLERHPALKGLPSGWCVVTQKGFWSRAYHNGYGKARLRECLDRGHKVLLTVGLVAKPDLPLNRTRTWLSCESPTGQDCLTTNLKLISVRAKLHAAQALFD